jgi:hypothetical protein
MVHPERIKARMAVNNAVVAGKLTRLPCTICDNPNSEGHHYLGYAKEHWLDVQWLCRKHHKEANERRKKN